MKIISVLFAFCLVIGMASISPAAEIIRVARITDLSGIVEVQSADGSWAAASVGMTLKQGDTIRTKSGSWAILNVNGIAETASVELKQNGQMKMAMLLKDEQAGTQDTLLDLSVGEILIKAKKLHSEKSKFEVKTPTSIVGVRGTTFSVGVEAEAVE